MLESENLFACRHLFAISDLLLRTWSSLARIISSFSVKHKSHLLADGRYGEHFFTIDQAISYCIFLLLSSQIYFESFVASLCFSEENDILWLEIFLWMCYYMNHSRLFFLHPSLPPLCIQRTIQGSFLSRDMHPFSCSCIIWQGLPWCWARGSCDLAICFWC